VVDYIQKNCTCPQVYSTVDTKEFKRHYTPISSRLAKRPIDN